MVLTLLQHTTRAARIKCNELRDAAGDNSADHIRVHGLFNNLDGWSHPDPGIE